LGCGNRKAALARDVILLGRMLGRIDVGVTAGAAVRAMHGLYKRVGRHMQLQSIAVHKLLLHAGRTVATKAILVGCGKRWDGVCRECRRRRNW
jgi:hypothetical protein